MTDSLTVAEKILFHLHQYLKSEDKYEVPFDVTQDGIAQSCGISRAHAAIELKKLRETSQIIEKLSHVRRAKSRRKVYFLTQEGKAKASKIAEHVAIEKVETGVDPSRISQGTGPARRLRRHSSAIPQPKQFFGREHELSELGSMIDDDSVEIIAVTGLGGIGKTTLLSRFAKESKSSVFWFSLNEWETELSLLKALSGFLEESGDNRLANYLKSDRIDLSEVSYLLGDALGENRKVMILDDVDKAPRLDATVKMILRSSGPNKILLASETSPRLIDELKGAGRSVKEMVLGGLELSAARELLKGRGIDGEKADRLCDLTGCHPMLLGLVPSADESSAKIETSNFVKKTLLKELSARDMAIVEKCSVLRKPCPSAFLPKDERHVLQLPIFYNISGNYAMHGMVRRIIADQIAMAERTEYHSSAADFYLSENNPAERLYHLIQSGRFIESEILIHSRLDELASAESPQNLLEETRMISHRMSKYTSSVQLLSARASAMLGDEQAAIDVLMKIAESESGDKKADAIIELADRSLGKGSRIKIFGYLKAMLADPEVSASRRSRVALCLASAKFSKGDLEESEQYIAKGLSIAANEFSLETISSLNRLMGQLLVKKGKYPKAIAFLGQTAPSFVGQHRSLYHRLMAAALRETGKAQEAKANLESGVKVAEESGLYKELADSLLDLCDVRLAEDDIDGAAESCYRCIEVSSSIGDNGVLRTAYEGLSSIEERRGNRKEAEESRAAALKIPKENGPPISSPSPSK